MSTLPITNIINVTITTTPQGLTARNVNNLLLLSNELPGNSDTYRTYVSAAQVAADYGTNSVTAAMANAIFAQTPNIRTGGGQLSIAPMVNSVSATSANVTTANISANLSALILVSAGDIKVTVDGIVYNLLNMNFTKCLTLIDVAAVLQNNLPGVVVTANATTISFTSNKVGTASSIALAAATGGTGTALNGAGYLNTSAAVTTAGVNSTGETILAAIARISGSVSFTGCFTTLNIEDTALTVVATGVQAQDIIFLHHFASLADIAGFATANKTAANTHFRPLLYTTSQAAARLMKAAYIGRAFSVNFTGSFTSSTMQLKQLATITPDLSLSQSNYNAALTAGIDCYVSFDGVSSVVSTGGNDYFDNVYSDLSLKFDLETAGFNFLRQTNTKVPQTEPGMNGLKATYAGVLNQYVRNGCIAPGSWTSSEKFGDPEIFVTNVLTNGFYIYSLPIVQQSAADRNARKAPLVQMAVKRAGAIHTSDVIVLVNN